KRLSERVVAFAGVERHSSPELITEIEAQLLEAVEPQLQAPALPAADMSGVIPFAELRDFDLSPTVLAMVPTKLIRSYRLLPVKLAGNLLTIAMVNPRDYAALAELKRTLHTIQIAPVAIGLEDFNSALVRPGPTRFPRAPRSRASPRASRCLPGSTSPNAACRRTAASA